MARLISRITKSVVNVDDATADLLDPKEWEAEKPAKSTTKPATKRAPDEK